MKYSALVMALVVVWVVLAGGASPAGAASAGASGDELVVRDSRIDWLTALDQTVVYRQFGRRGQRPRWAWGRVVVGRVLRARGIPKGARSGTIGRDRQGRIVLTMSVARRKGGSRAVDWWIYDVARDRARRLRGLARRGCAPHAVSIWRNRLAYAATCGVRSQSGIFLREGDRTRRVMALPPYNSQERVILRGGTLVALLIQDEHAVVWRLIEGGKTCRTQITDSFLPLEDWNYAGIWLAGDTLMWWVVDAFRSPRPGNLIGTRLGDCGPPGPTGTFAITSPPPNTARTTPVDVDGPWLYYADTDGIRRQLLPTRRQTEPPPNDDFEHAEPLVGDPPLLQRPTIGNATIQAGEPPLRTSATSTIWYAFQPITTQRVNIGASWPYGIFEGADLGALTQVGEPDQEGFHPFEAVVGHTYWIALGCQGFSCYVGSFLAISPLREGE
jgi:hypothetical protein